MQLTLSMAAILNARFLFFAIIVGFGVFWLHQYYQRQGLLISQNLARTGFMVVHDLSMQMDQVQQLIELAEKNIPKSSSIGLELDIIKRDLTDLWKETRQLYRSKSRGPDTERLLEALYGIVKRLDAVVLKYSENNPSQSGSENSFKSTWEFQRGRYQTDRERLLRTRKSYEDVLKMKERFANHPVLRFYLKPLQDLSH